MSLTKSDSETDSERAKAGYVAGTGLGLTVHVQHGRPERFVVEPQGLMFNIILFFREIVKDGATEIDPEEIHQRLEALI